MASPRTLWGLLGGAAALAAGGIAAGLQLERALVGRRVRPALATGGAPFFSVTAEGPEVITPDGVRLHVEVEEPPDQARTGSSPPPTIVLVHGYVLSLHCWHFQRLHARRLQAELGARILCYDQRSHGRSGRSSARFCRIPQLAEDLAQVIEATTEPDSPLVLVGHSMGGMTIMDLIRARPDWFDAEGGVPADRHGRVRGVALIATAANGLAETSLVPGVPGRVFSRLAPPLLAGLTRMPELVERTRRLGSDLASLTVQQYSFGRRDVPAALVDFMAAMVAETSLSVVADFYPAFAELDEIANLRRFAGIPTLVIGGRQDKITPVEHTERILDTLPTATGRILDRCGHMGILEWHALINAELETLYRAALGAAQPHTEAGGA